MRRRLKNNQLYPFAWLDKVIEITLNPDREFAFQLRADELQCLQEKFDMETWQVLNHLKTQTFYLFSPRKLKAVIQKYNSVLILLQQRAVINQEKYPPTHLLKNTGDAVIQSLNELVDAVGKRYPAFMEDPAGYAKNNLPLPDARLLKIICVLSIDQLGIILKAADDIKLIISRSLSLVFRVIVPYLSTRNKSELSWDSMRSNAYHPEERDKEAAIAALEKLIVKIREYQ